MCLRLLHSSARLGVEAGTYMYLYYESHVRLGILAALRCHPCRCAECTHKYINVLGLTAAKATPVKLPFIFYTVEVIIPFHG